MLLFHHLAVPRERENALLNFLGVFVLTLVDEVESFGGLRADRGELDGDLVPGAQRQGLT